MSGKRVMLVDDDRDFLTTTSAVLRRGGYEVLIASDAVSAISVGVKQAPQAVVLDIGLPGGDGMTVMERLHALPQLAGVPVLILSGRDPVQYRETAISSGAVAYLTKPVRPEELLDALKQALDDPEAGRSGAEVASGASGDGELILLVDDDCDLLAVLAATLRRRGFDVAVASDAVAAVSVAVKRRPQAVVLDVGLPGGDGTTVMLRMHAMPQLAGVPVIMLSGRDPAAYRDAALSSGAVAYLTKPVDAEELVEALLAALNPA